MQRQFLNSITSHITYWHDSYMLAVKYSALQYKNSFIQIKCGRILFALYMSSVGSLEEATCEEVSGEERHTRQDIEVVI